MQSRNVTADLTSMFEGDDQDINLARAALLFSTIEHPDLDIDAFATRKAAYETFFGNKCVP